MRAELVAPRLESDLKPFTPRDPDLRHHAGVPPDRHRSRYWTERPVTTGTSDEEDPPVDWHQVRSGVAIACRCPNECQS